VKGNKQKDTRIRRKGDVELCERKLLLFPSPFLHSSEKYHVAKY
jgi:hypothetical protein